ncbi:MAG: hypothetical protein PWQ08_330 [Clostridiales bacterium]|nr:hypothetical protein [Clostridiales bacterium]
MKTYNQKFVKLAEELSAENVKKSQKTAQALTRPSNATCFGSMLGLTIGAGLVCGGLVGCAIGKGVFGMSSFVVGAITITSNIATLKNARRAKEK